MQVNTHFYDTKLKELYQHMLELDNKALQKPLPLKVTVAEIRSSAHDCDRGKLNRVLSMLESNDINNYDPANNIHVHDLLPRVWRFVKNYEDTARAGFYEQLIDILSGSCSQGRTTRLIQFYTGHMTTKDDEIFNKVRVV